MVLWWLGTAWVVLPTGVQCAAGAEEDGGGGMQLGRSKLGSGSNRIGRVCWSGAVAREREKVKALWWAFHGSEEVAAGGSSGMSWRARVQPGREREAAGTEGRWRVEGVAAGGGALEVCAGGERRWQGGAEGKRRWSEEEEADWSQKDSFVNPKKSRDSSVN
jgi:hypothetical protein